MSFTPHVDFDPLSESGLPHVTDVLSEARSRCPVFYSEKMQAWAVTGYDDIRSIARDASRFSSVNAVSLGKTSIDPEVYSYLRAAGLPEHSSLVDIDDPEHSRRRKLVLRAFTARRVKAMETETKRMADTLIDAFIDAGQVEILSAYSFPLAVSVIMGILGVPDERMGDCLKWTSDIESLPAKARGGATVEEQLRLAESQVALWEYAQALVAEREREGRDDLISDVIAASRASDTPMTTKEMASLLPGLVMAGHRTTATLIGNTIYNLLVDQTRWQSLCEKPNGLPEAIEEVLRWDPPVLGVGRKATADVVVRGETIKDGDNVMLVWYSGNRDANIFECPERFNADRPMETPHLTFGVGSHFCLGASLARMTSRVAIERVLERIPNARLVSGTGMTLQPHAIFRARSEVRIAWM
jgi:cytochrome P450